ncbi:hypothetical protein MMC17_001652 [Xylographa soralifera]|nr:hypothetical protein [Xylographa soralifera]
MPTMVSLAAVLPPLLVVIGILLILLVNSLTDNWQLYAVQKQELENFIKVLESALSRARYNRDRRMAEWIPRCERLISELQAQLPDNSRASLNTRLRRLYERLFRSGKEGRRSLIEFTVLTNEFSLFEYEILTAVQQRPLSPITAKDLPISPHQQSQLLEQHPMAASMLESANDLPISPDQRLQLLEQNPMARSMLESRA